MDYDKEYFESIERYAPFSFFAPLTRRSKSLKKAMLLLILLKERLFAIGRARWIVKKLHPSSALDVGTAGGELVAELVKRSVNACGVDMSEYKVSVLSQAMKKKIFLAQAGDLPFADKSFDVVSAYHVLEHIIESELTSSMRELARVSDKYIIIELPTTENYNVSIDPTHVSIFGYNKWMRIMTDALGVGWTILQFKKPNYLNPLFVVFVRA